MLNNHIDRINSYFARGNCSIKSYKTWTNASKKAEVMNKETQEFFGASNDLRYVIVPLDNGRWTPIFFLSDFIKIAKCGGYLPYLADRGFYSI